MSSDYCVLALSFREGDNELARLRISADSDRVSGRSAPADVPEYVIAEDSLGVNYIDEFSEIDGITSIQVYTGSEQKISPILLLENITYELALGGEVESAFDYLRENDKDLSLRKLHFKGKDGEDIYTLNFHGYAGKGFLDVTCRGRRIEIPIEVRSRKIGYLTDYPKMLSDIAEFSTVLLLTTKSPLHTYYEASRHPETTAYEDFLVLDYLFSKLDFPGIYRHVRDNMYSELISHTESVPAGLASDVDPSDLTSLVYGDNMIPFEGGPIHGTYCPNEVSERIWRDSIDVPENRMVRDLVLSLDSMVRSLRSTAQASCSDYILARLSEMGDCLDDISRDQWLLDVGEMNVIPYDSTVLQSRYGYSDLFRMYQMLGLGATFRLDSAESILSGQNKKLHFVYEYWCYTRLYRCLSKLSKEKPEFPIEKTDGNWTVSIRNNSTRFLIDTENSHLIVDLYYNKGFARNNDVFKSYSVKLRPDFTLRVNSSSDPDRMFIVNFDAKYKAKPLAEDEIDLESGMTEVDSWEYDICKMHTYRDALIHSCGSYVLFPGTNYNIFRKPWNQKDWDDLDGSFIPSVGAIPLIPDRKDDEELHHAMIQILDKISKISAGRIDVEDVRDYLF